MPGSCAEACPTHSRAPPHGLHVEAPVILIHCRVWAGHRECICDVAPVQIVMHHMRCGACAGSSGGACCL